jgi:metal-dependent amidase/aminoacylase/carboxypeptidase family protein
MAASDWFTENKHMALIHGLEFLYRITIVLGLQTIVSRNVNLTESAAVSVGQINAGVRSNVIPEELTMTGTIRSLDGKVQDMLHARIKQVVTSIAESAGATPISI